MVIAHNNVCACVKQFWKQASTHSPFEGLTFQHHAVLMLPPPDFFHKPSRTNKAKLPDCFIFLNALFSLIHHPVISKSALPTLHQRLHSTRRHFTLSYRVLCRSSQFSKSSTLHSFKNTPFALQDTPVTLLSTVQFPGSSSFAFHNTKSPSGRWSESGG